MNKIIFGVLAVVGSFMLVESLTCNKCTVGVLSLCLNPSTLTCTTNTSACFTGKATFPSISNSIGFSTQGCLNSDLCNSTNATNSILGVSYTIVTQCCSTNNCNPSSISGATSAKLSVTAAIGAALVASVWGSMLY
uniref:UPAR/Ly6 domain-containing protein n=1 Tax=Esox lucius TaxID=8010 RepID=A0AAY5K236_ESOLU